MFDIHTRAQLIMWLNFNDFTISSNRLKWMFFSLNCVTTCKMVASLTIQPFKPHKNINLIINSPFCQRLGQLATVPFAVIKQMQFVNHVIEFGFWEKIEIICGALTFSGMLIRFVKLKRTRRMEGVCKPVQYVNLPRLVKPLNANFVWDWYVVAALCSQMAALAGDLL